MKKTAYELLLLKLTNLFTFKVSVLSKVMQRIQSFFLAPALFVILTSCTHSTLPKVMQIERLKQTEFVPTMENRLDENKNVIYSPAFLFAWNKVKQSLVAPIIITNHNSIDFKLLNASTTFQNSLEDDEYEAEGYIDGAKIITKAFFNKTLPFSSKLQRVSDGITFNNKTVAAFGMKNLDEKITKFTQILFYKDDDHFLIKLIPRDTLNQIILVKGLQNIKTFDDVLEQTRNLINDGKTEKQNPKNFWKYIFNPNDEFLIPVIRFNIEKNYKSLTGQTFTSNKIVYPLQIAYQRTALVLDENGAVIESEGNFAADSVATPEKIHPKKMDLNKLFFIVIQKVGKKNPYFVMKVANTELMEKVQ